MKIENWNGYDIRFVDRNGEWWAVAKDVTDALGLKQVTRAISTLKGVTKSKVLTNGGEQEVSILDEKNIYRLAFKSRKKEAEDFQDWVFETIKQLRQSIGLEGFEVFRMLDKEHQKQAMKNLQGAIKEPKRQDFMKANTITNKAVSTKFGYQKMLKKSDMTPEMLVAREPILDDTVDLMSVKDKFDLPISVSERIYAKHTQTS
ncbi:phage antirepressor protein [Streptococcus acidominimus]|uniref:Phage antirepressor protein n=1 Tax=Streptococcus acidominimus TaxID=1326 RepID=A0A239X103_STRAI|nr:BRO family protein [Streptococcus acidominimus]SNV39624.1 phage antirepressor protein [Streptococcus acidominimus]